MLKDENKESLRELLHLPHFHQYEKNYVDMLDHGKKLKLNLKSKIFKSKANENEESNDEQVNFEFEETANNVAEVEILCKELGNATDESISIDLESIDGFRSKVNYKLKYYLLAMLYN